MKYAYPAIFTKESNNLYSVLFPDFEGTGYSCATSGDNLTDALEMAKDALCLVLYTMEQDGQLVPKSSDVKTLSSNENEFTSIIACDTNEYKRFFEKRAVRKTLTVPSWLNAKAEQQGVNFSQVLQEALINQLGL